MVPDGDKCYSLMSINIINIHMNPYVFEYAEHEKWSKYYVHSCDKKCIF